MSPVDIYITFLVAFHFLLYKFSRGLFLLKVKETLMSVENMYFNESQNQCVNNFCLKLRYLGLILFMHFSN